MPAPRDHRVDLAPLAQSVRGMKADDAKELKELRRENVADQALDIDVLKELNRGTSDPGLPPAGGGRPPSAVRGLRAQGLHRRRPASFHPAPRRTRAGR